MLPEVAGQYLADYLLQAGPTLSGGFGPVPLNHMEMWAWQRNIGIVLSPWEVLTVIRLSRVWCAEAARAEKPDAPPPLFGSLIREDVARKIDEAFG